MSTTGKRDQRDYRNQPIYWFGVLDIARERQDYARAAEAKRELERLGVRVKFSRPGVTDREESRG